MTKSVSEARTCIRRRETVVFPVPTSPVRMTKLPPSVMPFRRWRNASIWPLLI